MRIAGEHTIIELDQRFGSKREVIGDMQALYGGELKKTPSHGLLGMLWPRRSLEAEGVQAEAYADVQSVMVYSQEVSGLVGAMRWTALQAYRAKGGIAAIGHLRMESESGPGYHEWASRKDARLVENLRGVEQARAYASTAPSYLKAKVGLERACIHDTRRHLREAGIPDFFATVPSLAGPDLSYPQPEITTFHALGKDLIDTAHTMADGYGELVSDSEGADLMVAQALGASSLEHLSKAWDWAKTRSTPLEAGRAMLRGLAAGDIVVG